MSACSWMKAHPWRNCFAKLPLAGSCQTIRASCWQAFEAEEQRSAGESPLPDWRGQSSPASQPLIEPLSQRELEVLRLFKTDLSGPEIARELMIALSTVRTHTKSIYSKLNVKNRRAAVQRAAELDLI